MLALFLLVCQVLLIFSALVFFISGLDDFLIDVVHAVRSTYRWLFVYSKRQRLTEAQLLERSEQPIAIMIPAWQEHAVIARMLDNVAETVNYANYHIFVGCYQNDEETQLAIEGASERYDNVHSVVVPNDGPTSKADCLNWVLVDIWRFEEAHGIEFVAFVLHDAEDVIHPLSLKLYNYLVPRKDMIQLPVFPFEPRWYEFTPGHYIDEFAETHTKDLVVRERLSGSLPSAGVGCAFSRAAVQTAAAHNDNRLFNPSSLTEDYELGLRLSEFGLEQIFVNQAIERVQTSRHPITGRQRAKRVREYIATREIFPSTFSAAVRQKTRWVTGITLQGWRNLGWRGGIGVKYMLFRDRKGLLTNQVNVLGYVLLVMVVVLRFQEQLFPGSYLQRTIVPSSTWFSYVLVADTFFLILRLAQRSASVYRVYGAGQALLCIPRLVWSNVINFVASVRAIKSYVGYLVTGQSLAWEKTDHEFPSAEQLNHYRRKLGDLLIERRIIRVGELDEALAKQKENHRPLGAILVDLGYADEEKVLQVLGTQLRLLTTSVDPYEVDLDVLRLVPRRLAIRYSLFPVEVSEKGVLLIATDLPLQPEDRQQVESALGRRVQWCLATRGDVGFAIRWGFERLAADRAEDLLGQRLLALELVTPAELQDALKEQRRLYTRLGAGLSELGFLTDKALKRALQEYDTEEYFGEFLVRQAYVTQEQLNEGLAVQQGRSRTLGDLLVERGAVDQTVINEIVRQRDVDGE